jgi:hypothetical protein
VVLGGLVTVGATALIAWRVPDLRRLEKLE